MAAITYQDAKEIKDGIVNIHKMLELRKLHIKRIRAGKACGVCESFCHELGLQKQTRVHRKTPVVDPFPKLNVNRGFNLVRMPRPSHVLKERLQF
jgi:hypothetical protein